MSNRASPPHAPAPPREARLTFACFGGECTVIVADADRSADAVAAAAVAKRSLLSWHERFSRFAPDSEISRFNRNPRERVKVSPLLGRLVAMTLQGVRDTGGLVDATLGAEIERAGYRYSLTGDGLALDRALAMAPPRAPARPSPADPAQRISFDAARSEVQRRPGTVLDPGGVAKGVFADELAARLADFDAFAVDCAGDIRLGGRARIARPIHVTSPFDGARLHTFALRDGAIATSGIGKRSWLDADAQPAHHLLDPSTGRPAYTGVVQATALAPTGAQAEVLAKAAVLSGPDGAAQWLRHGGMFVRDDGSYELLEPASEASARPRSDPFANRSASQPRISVSTSSRSGSFKISWNRPG
jgi:thiamine biosynthesis lipoprotein